MDDTRITAEDLIDVYWKTADALDADSDDGPRHEWHLQVFEKILIHCGWTVDEWNTEMDLLKTKEDT